MADLPADLRGLTLIQPMGWALFHGCGGVPLGPGLKDVENRDWSPALERIGQVIAIHGGKSYDPDYEELCLDLLGIAKLPAEAHATGILGLVTIDRVISEKNGAGARGGCGWVMRREGWKKDEDPAFKSPWYMGSRGWCLRDQVLFQKPVPCRGSRTLWPVPAEVRPLVEAAARDGFTTIPVAFRDCDNCTHDFYCAPGAKLCDLWERAPLQLETERRG